jgi:GNAT superfamily N-acetyltransferase
MKILGPVTRVERECERVLRTLPDWFGDEESLLEYADNTARLNTFVAEDNGRIVGFLSLQQHLRSSWEINCIAVEAGSRNAGVGRALQQRAEDWLKKQGAKTLQVKTLADSHPSPDYAETRLFYEAVGYIPIEVFPTLWHEGLPVLQFIKLL